jgi:AraC-like DNA-binding protein
MQAVIRPLFLLHEDTGLRTRLTRIPGQPYRIAEVADWTALADGLRRSPPTALSIVNPMASGSKPGSIAPGLEVFLRAYPRATVLAALHVAPQHPDVLRGILRCGVSDIIDLTRETTPVALGRRLGLVSGRAVQLMLTRALPQSLPSRVGALLGKTAEVVADGGQAAELAAALGVGERTLPRWFEKADLPPARRVLAWLRILMAADLLDDPTRSVESVARSVGYATGTSFKHAVRSLLETTPYELRQRGAFDTAAVAFASELAALRRKRLLPPPARRWLN